MVWNATINLKTALGIQTTGQRIVTIAWRRGMGVAGEAWLLALFVPSLAFDAHV